MPGRKVLHKEFLLVLLVQMNDLLFGFLSFLLILVFLEFLVGCFGFRRVYETWCLVYPLDQMYWSCILRTVVQLLYVSRSS